jgi:histidinol-phosphatase (PHP family)
MNHRTPVLYDTHMHTPLCRHATGMPGDYAAIACQRRLKGIIVTCHNPMPATYAHQGRIQPDELPEYVRMVRQASEEWAGRVDVLLGLESDYLPGLDGMDNWLRDIHARADFHYILGSIHPHLPDYRAAFHHGDDREFQKGYFAHLAQAAETGLFDSLSHPDLVKNTTAANWNVASLQEDIHRSLDRIAATGIAMELNTSGLTKTIPEMNPGREILAGMHARGIPVVIGSDAHKPERVGEAFPEALEILRETGYTVVSGFRHRRRYDIPLSVAQESLLPR